MSDGPAPACSPDDFGYACVPVDPSMAWYGDSYTLAGQRHIALYRFRRRPPEGFVFPRVVGLNDVTKKLYQEYAGKRFADSGQRALGGERLYMPVPITVEQTCDLIERTLGVPAFRKAMKRWYDAEAEYNKHSWLHLAMEPASNKPFTLPPRGSVPTDFSYRHTDSRVAFKLTDLAEIR